MFFFTADLHFGDNEIIERESRPFGDVREFTDAFVKNVNDVASEDDILYILGDWINYNKTNRHTHEEIKETLEICKRLTPKVILIDGNNEQRAIEEIYGGDFEKFRSLAKECGFADFVREADVAFEGKRYHLIHHPKDYEKGVLNLFGHTHRGTGLWKPFGFNMCVDLNYFRPFSQEDIYKLLKMKEWWDNDPDTHCM
ncbi:MAG: hypothetical protein K6G75_00810 [Lachnospiraceae bacterium]|nr:hypothetical protein [Lachnospiraceae bacterium]